MSPGLLKVWQLGSSSPNFTLEGHEKGVNCIDYYSGGDKPYLISGADDRQVKIWDYQVRKHFDVWWNLWLMCTLMMAASFLHISFVTKCVWN